MPHVPAPLIDTCEAGRHLPGTRIVTDARGIQHTRCRRCGCDLARIPAIRRWYQSGMLGD